MIDKLHLARVAALGALLLLTAQSAGEAVEVDYKPIKIGFMASLTGVGAEPSQDMVRGIQLYLKLIRHKIAGRPVQLIVENDESSAATGFQKIKKLLEEDKVDILDGVQLSNVALAVAPLADKYKVPFVLLSGADDLTQRKRVAWAIRTGQTASQSSHPFGEYAYKKLGYRRIAIVGADYPFGWEVCGGFQKSFEESGGQIVQRIWVPLGFTDFKSQLAQLRTDVDAVYIGATSAAAKVLVRQYKELGNKIPLLCTGAAVDEAIIDEIGSDAMGAVSAMNYAATIDSAANKKFAKQFAEAYAGSEPSYYSENGYTSAMWIQKALEAVKGNVSDKERLLKALQQVKLTDAPRGPLALDSFNSAVQNVYIRRVKRRHGKQLENSVIETYKNVSQFWKWNPEEYLKSPVYSKTVPPCKFCASN